MTEFLLKSTRVVLPGKPEPVPASVRVRDGKIVEIIEGRAEGAGIDLGSRVLMPGIVDTHAHINEPGRTEWEGFETATRAAAAGGITTVIDMPLNSIPPTTTLQALQVKRASAKGHCTIDHGFWGGVIPGNAHELQAMIDAGIFGFKCFLCDSGVDEFPKVTETDLREAMPILARAGVPLLVHAELESPVVATDTSPRDYQSYLSSRPQKWEVDAIRMVIRLARETGCRTHIVHLSAADALPDLRAARAAGVPITAETCPHYLSLEADEIQDGATQFKCAPPIRERENREKLWEAIRRAEIAFIVSDHSPCTPALKRLEQGDFSQAWGGIAGLQFSLSVVWTEMRARGFSVVDLSRLMSAQTAEFLGLMGRKGGIQIGADADLVAWDPDASFVLAPEQVLHRHKLTPYSGRKLFGRVERTWVRGQSVYENGEFLKAPAGEGLTRPRSGLERNS